MLHKVAVSFKFWSRLQEIDEQTAARVAAGGCPRCGGRLHRGDYERKPRGGLFAAVAEGAARRISFCCDREGCRRRCMPPSVRFLGRKVYVGAAIVIACVAAEALATAGAVRRATGIPARTVWRWRRWWHTSFTNSRTYQAMRSRFMPPVDTERLPGSLWERLVDASGDELEGLAKLLVLVAPVSTSSMEDGARFLRDAWAPAEDGATRR